MRNRRLCRWYVAICTGSTFAILSGCPLPDRFFENTVRSLTATIADQVVSNVILELTGIVLGDASGTGDATDGDGG